MPRWRNIEAAGHNYCRHKPAKYRLYEVNFDWMFEDGSIIANDYSISVCYETHGPE